MPANLDLWRKHALQWRHVGQPLRPTLHDIHLLERHVARLAAARAPAPLRAALLGVTPEIADMAWPPRTELLAFDRAAPMIETIWPGDTAMRQAVCADWLQAPLAPRSRDVVLGDGVFNVLPDASFHPRVARSMADLLAHQGRALIRVFVRPQPEERPQTVLDALLDGAVANFHVFKFRLAMALQDDVASGVRLGDVWSAWHAAVDSPARLAERMGWCEVTVSTIDAYRDLDLRFSFPSAAEFEASIAASFAVEQTFWPGYEFGQCCPTFALAPVAR